MKCLSVIRLADAWTIVASGKRWGRFAYQVDAEEAALRLAGKAASRGETAEVLIQGRWGEMRRLMLVEAA
jgi:hypothetical protein